MYEMPAEVTPLGRPLTPKAEAEGPGVSVGHVVSGLCWGVAYCGSSWDSQD